MTTNPQTDRADRVTAAYDSIVAFQRKANLSSLRLAQIRMHLAEHLADTLLAAVSVPAPAPTDQAADWGALVREAGRLRREGAELNDRAEEIDARVAKLKLRTAEIRAAALTEAADFLRDAHFRDGLSVQEIGTAIRHWADRELADAASGSGRVADEVTSYAERVNAPLGEATISALREQLASEAVPVRTVHRRVAGEAQQPETQAAVYLSTPCDACRHTLNWHRNDVGCTIDGCVCGRFQQPAVVSQPDGEA